MKKLLLWSLAVLAIGSGYRVQACTIETIDSVVSPIDAYKHNGAAMIQSALQTLAICDENLLYAGEKIGASVNPYQPTVASMSQVIGRAAATVPPDMSLGFARGLIQEFNLYRAGPTYHMTQAIVNIASANYSARKEIVLSLTKERNSYAPGDVYLGQAIDIILKMGAGGGGSSASSIWAFRSENRQCETYTGHWGRYNPCPQYYASVTNSQGDTLVLWCGVEHAGIDFGIRYSQSQWNELMNYDLQTISFGTEAIEQELGLPYVIPQVRTLWGEEPLSEELLQALRTGRQLTVTARLNSGEHRISKQFTLRGSNIAIEKLLNSCAF